MIWENEIFMSVIMIFDIFSVVNHARDPLHMYDNLNRARKGSPSPHRLNLTPLTTLMDPTLKSTISLSDSSLSWDHHKLNFLTSENFNP